MSMLSALSSHVDQEGELLQRLNDAVLSVQAAVLGDMELLGITDDKLEKASVILVEFLEKLKSALNSTTNDPTVSMLVENIRYDSDKPVEEWEEDIQSLIDSLKSGKLNGDPSLLSIIEDILNLLNADYSTAVKALYFRYR
ncbi:MAG: hypothetical protein JRJ85_04610 [Deltaproteobacteria bacterium]|nr:hypothetical protein [Deltaproteobacteria bacterium]